MKKRINIDQESIDDIGSVVNSLTGFELEKGDLNDEVILKSLIFLKLNEIESQLNQRKLSISFTENVYEYILSKTSKGAKSIKQINRSIKNIVMKFLHEMSNQNKLIEGGKHIIDVYGGRLIFRHSIAFDVPERT